MYKKIPTYKNGEWTYKEFETQETFIEFLLTPEAQKHMVNNSYEYPMIETVKPSTLIEEMGLSFKQDNATKVSSYGKWQKLAFKLMKKAGWN